MARDTARFDVVNESSGEVLETVTGARQAQRAQQRWHKGLLWNGGPETTLRPHTAANSLDAALEQHIPEEHRDIYREAILLLLRTKTPVSDIMLAADLAV